MVQRDSYSYENTYEYHMCICMCMYSIKSIYDVNWFFKVTQFDVFITLLQTVD